MEQELLKAEKLKGSKLSKNEKFLIEQFWNNKDFELRFYEKNNSIGYHKITFEDWFKMLIAEGVNRKYPINTEDPEAYRDYFKGGYSAEETIDEDASYLT